MSEDKYTRQRENRNNEKRYEEALKKAALKIEELYAEVRALKKQDPIAVIGIACRFPGGANSPDEYWNLLKNGFDASQEVPKDRWESEAYYDPNPDIPGKAYTKRGSFLDTKIDRFDSTFFEISGLEAESLDPQQRLLLEVSWEALENAGLNPRHLKGSATGIFVGISGSEYQAYLTAGGMKDLDAYMYTGVASNAACGRLSYFYDFCGPSVSVDTACSSSIVSVHLAAESLSRRRCDLALAGGVQLILRPEGFIVLCQMKALSPDGRCKAFSNSADGYGRGEGCGFVVLKRLSDALEDGDRILALISGTEVYHDGRSNGFTAPSGMAQEKVIRSALEKAGLSPDNIDYVEAHGTGTSLGDLIEVQALSNVFKNRREKLPIGSVKSNIGHLEAAAGIAGLIKVILALQHDHIPQSLHSKELNPSISWQQLPLKIAQEFMPWKRTNTIRSAGISSFGIGGTITHTVITEPPKIQPKQSKYNRTFNILTFSAKKQQTLLKLAQLYQVYLSQTGDSIEDICYTSNISRTSLEHRLAVIGASKDELHRKLSNYISAPEKNSSRTSASTKTQNKKLVFMFTGQGSQYTDMGKELYENSVVFKNALDRCDKIFSNHIDRSLIDLLYAENASQETLNQTQYTQPVIFAIEYALLQLWESYGITPSVVVGHSIGAYAAAYAAGIMKLEDAAKLVAERGKLIQSLPADGTMAVLYTDEEHAEALLSGIPEKETSIAAVNGPRNVTISGKQATIEHVCKKAGRAHIPIPVDVSRAFHSSMMEPILDQFYRCASEISFSSPNIRMISDMTGKKEAAKELANPRYWTEHVRRPIRFYRALQTLEQEGYQIFLEIGGTDTLTGIARECVTDQQAVFLPSLKKGRNAWQQLLGTLSRLYLHGVEIDWKGFHQSESQTRVVLPTYPFERKQFWKNIEISQDTAHKIVIRSAEQREGFEEAQSEHIIPVKEHHSEIFGLKEGTQESIQEQLVEIIHGISKIDIPDIDKDERFFSLGLDSLMLIEIKERIRRKYGLDIPLKRFFKDLATITKLSLYIYENPVEADSMLNEENSQYPQVSPDTDNLHVPFPLTEVQMAYLLGRSTQFELGGVATHYYGEFETKWDIPRFNKALQRVIDRHPMLRTIIMEDGRQQILEELPTYEIEVEDLSHLSTDEQHERLMQARKERSHYMAPVGQWPMFEFKAFKLDEDTHYLTVNLDFLVLDAASLQIIGKEIIQWYKTPDMELPELEFSFRDYILAYKELKNSVAYERDKQFWRNKLTTFPSAPAIPLKSHPSDIAIPHFKRLKGSLNQEQWKTLKQIARKHAVSPSTLLCTVYASVLSYWSNQSELSLNLTVFNRYPFHKDVEKIVGDFTSIMILDVRCKRDETLWQRAKAVQSLIFEALEHRHYDGVEFIRDLAHYNNLEDQAVVPFIFTSMLVDTGEGGSLDFTEQVGEMKTSVSQTPQVFIDHQVGESHGRVVLTWDYVEELFEDDIIQAMFQQYLACLMRLLEEPQEDVLNMLTVDRDAHTFIERYNNTSENIPAALLHQLFQEQAQATPERIAIQDGEKTITYKVLDEKSNQVAHCLRQQYGVGRNDFVGILAERSIDSIVYVMGILKTGAAYVPIDPEYPEDRREYIQNNSGCKLVLLPDFYTIEGVADYAVEPVEVVNQPDDVAYIIYTSGSTGRPKGVVITHGAVTNTIQDINRKFQVNSQDAFIGISSMCFDLSVYDVFGALTTGARLVVVKDQRDFSQLMTTVQNAGVSIWNSVPAIMDKAIEQLVNFDTETPRDEMTAEAESDQVYYWNPVIQWEKQGNELCIGGRTYSDTEVIDLFPEFYFFAQDGLIYHEIPEKFAQVEANKIRMFVNELIEHRILVNSLLTPEELFPPQNQLFNNKYTDEIVYIPEKYNVFKKKQLTRTYPVYGQSSLLMEAPDDMPAFVIERRSHRNFDETRPISSQVFSKFISFLKQTQVENDIRYFYPSLSGAYPIDIFVYVKEGRIEDISEGLYYYHPADNSLHLVNQGKKIPPEIHQIHNRSIFESSAFTLFMIYNGDTLLPGREETSYTEACIEAGIIVGALSQAAELLGLGLCSVGVMNFEAIREEFALGKNQVWIHTVEGGLKGDLQADAVKSHIRLDKPMEDIDILKESGQENKYWWAPGTFWRYEEQGVRIEDHVYTGVALNVFPRLYFLAQHGVFVEKLSKMFPQVQPDELNELLRTLIQHKVLVNNILPPEQLGRAQKKLANTLKREEPKESKDDAAFIHKQLTRTYKRYHHTPMIMFGDRTYFPSFIKNKQFCPTFRHGRKLPITLLSKVLATFKQVRKDQTLYYCYASAGGLYPIDIFLHVKQDRIEGVEGGMYYYDPIEHGLHRINAMDSHWEEPSDGLSAFSVYFVYNAEVSMPKYGGLGYFFAHIDTGIMIELMNEVAEFLGVGLRPVKRIGPEKLAESCRLTKYQVLLQVVEVGIKEETILEEHSFAITEPILGTEDEYVQYHPGKPRARENDQLRLVLLSGDWIPVDLPDKIKHYFPRAEVISLGGATEASIWSIYYPIDTVHKEWKSIPYGMPLANQTFYVLNYAGQLCPIGTEGELYIGGTGVAQKYMNDEKKTSDAFITHPQLGRLYKTGDYGVLNPKGYIEFHGRKDNQVKVRGYRIELGEIESVLREHVAIKDVVVLAKELQPGDTRLVAYFSTHSLVYWDSMEDYFETHNRFCRRKEVRVHYDVPCTVMLQDGRSFATMIEDISYNGIGLKIAQGLLRQGDKARLSFILPQNSEQCEIEASVIHVSENRKGLRFDTSSEQNLLLKAAVDYLTELYEIIVIDYRRGEYRIPLKVPCLIHAGEEDIIEVYTEDISFSGIGLKDVPDIYKAGDQIRVSFHLPTKELTIEGIIQWIDQGCAGVTFSHYEDSIVRRFVEGEVSSKGLTIGKLRSYMQKKLPDYMIPSIFVRLEEFPLTSNGKIDRKALPNPTEVQQKPESKYVKPKTRMERLLVDMFQELLGLEKVGVKDNFFELGASSVHMIEGVRKLREELQQNIPVIVFFEYSNIQKLAQFLSKGTRQEEEVREEVSAQSKRRDSGKMRAQQRRKKAKQFQHKSQLPQLEAVA